MKRMVCIIIALGLLAGLFSACAGKKASEGAETGKQTSSSAGKTEVQTEAPKKPVTIKIFRSGTPKPDNKDFELDIMPKLVKEKFPHITIEGEKLPDDQFVTTLKTQLAAGEGPDIFYYWAGLYAKELVEAGYCRDLTGQPVLDKFSKTSIDAFTFNGKPYGISSGAGAFFTWYNKDMFEKAGIAGTPKDWPSFLDVCEKLKKAGFVPIVSSNKDWWYLIFGWYQIAASRVYAVDPDFNSKLVAGEKHFTDPEITDVIEKYVSLYKNGYVFDKSLGIGGPQGNQLFIDGKAAMKFDGNWAYADMMNKGAAEFKRGVFALPANDPAKPLGLSTDVGTAAMFNAKSENFEDIMAVVNYMFEKDSPLFNAWKETNTGSFPTHKDVLFDVPEFNEYFNLMKNAYGTPTYIDLDWEPGTAEELNAKLQECLAGRVTVKQVMEAAENKLRELQAQKN